MPNRKTGTFLQITRVAMMAAVLLSFVAVIGLSLLWENDWTMEATWSATLLLFTVIFLVTARGSRSASLPRPIPAAPSAPAMRHSTAQLVPEASYVREGVRRPLGESFGLLMD